MFRGAVEPVVHQHSMNAQKYQQSAIRVVAHSGALVCHRLRHPIGSFHTHTHTPPNFAGIFRELFLYRIPAGNGSVHALTIHAGFSVNVWKIYLLRWTHAPHNITSTSRSVIRYHYVRFMNNSGESERKKKNNEWMEYLPHLQPCEIFATRGWRSIFTRFNFRARKRGKRVE